MASVQFAANDLGARPAGRFPFRIPGWQRVLLVSATVAGIAGVLAFLAAPQYKGETRLLIEKGGVSHPGTADEVSPQVEVLQSTDLLAQVALRLDLEDVPEFDAATESSLFARLLVVVGLSSDPGEVSPRERVLKAFRDKLSVDRVTGSRIIAVGFRSENAGLAAAIPNALADAYLGMQETAGDLSRAAAWLEPEIASVSRQVEDSEARAAALRVDPGSLLPGDHSVARAISDLTGELTRVRAIRAGALARAGRIEAVLMGNAAPNGLSEVPSSAGLATLRQAQARLGLDFTGMSDPPPGARPGSAVLSDRLEMLKRQVTREADTALKGLLSDSASAAEREKELLRQIGRLRDGVARAQEFDVELRGLEREIEGRRELLDSYVAWQKEAIERRDGNFPLVEARIVQRAVLPSEPYFPDVLLISGTAFVVSLLVMSLLALTRELRWGGAGRPGSLATPEPIDEVSVPQTASFQLERTPRLPPPVDVTMPPPSGRQEADGPSEIGIEGAAEILLARGARRAIFVCPDGDVAALGSVLVAREIADAGRRVLLLDLTAGGAASRRMLHSIAHPGITDLLASQAQFTDVIHQDEHSDCHVMPVGTADPERAMRAADRLPIIMDSLTAAYDIVVVECGPTDAEGISRLVTEETEVLVGLVGPGAEVTETAEGLRRAGHGRLMLVSPAGYRPPVARARHRSAA